MWKKIPLAITVVGLAIAVCSTAFAQQLDASAERQLLQSLNQERARAGLPSLTLEDRLTQAARAHSRLMAKEKQLSHQFAGEPALTKRLAATGLRFNQDAENVAFDFSVQAAHEGLMLSPPHRANILSPKYDTVGVGVVRRGEVLWVTEDFAHRLEEFSRDGAESAIIAAFESERRKVSGVPAKVVRLPQLRRMACTMAKQEQLDTRAPLKLPNVQSAVVYTDPDPSQLPSNAIKMARDPGVTRFSVGVCFADGEKYPAGTWWVVLVFL